MNKTNFSHRLSIVAATFLAVFLFGLAPTTAAAQIVALGASNVQGYGVSSSEAFPAQLEAMLRAKGKNYSVSNAGVFGDTTSGMLSRLDSAVPSGTRIVVLAVGGNDARSGISQLQTRANVQQIGARLAGRGVRVINAQPYLRAAIQGGMTQSDGIHLNSAGHRSVAAQVAPQIK